MAGREVREYTNLTDPKDKKWSGKGKERIDDEEITFQRMVAKGSWLLYGVFNICRCKRLQENVVATFMGEEVLIVHLLFFFLIIIICNLKVIKCHCHSFFSEIISAALDSDDLLYLKEQMEAEEDAERLLRRTEKRAFAAFKKAVADTSTAPVPLPLRVEPKPKSGIRQQDLLKRVVEVKPKRQRHSNGVEGNQSSFSSSDYVSNDCESDSRKVPEKEVSPSRAKASGEPKLDNPVKSLLLAYESSEDED